MTFIITELFFYLLVFQKYLEKLFLIDFARFLDEHSVLLHTILDIVTSVCDNINAKLFTEKVTLDLIKTFDTMCHDERLFKKLKQWC